MRMMFEVMICQKCLGETFGGYSVGECEVCDKEAVAVRGIVFSTPMKLADMNKELIRDIIKGRSQKDISIGGIFNDKS